MKRLAINKLPPVAILAGGLAKRLRPITESIPKALVKVNGKPFIVHQMEQLKAEGITHIVCCVGYKGGMIEEMIGDGAGLGIHVAYSHDGQKLLGTGGAIKNAIKKLGSEFFVLYGDSYLRVSYRAVKEKFDRDGKKGLLTIFENQGQWDASNLCYKDDRIVAYSKKTRIPEMTYIDYGLSLLKSETFNDYPENEDLDLTDVYEKLVRENQLTGYEATERFYEIGSLEGLKELEAFIKLRR